MLKFVLLSILSKPHTQTCSIVVVDNTLTGSRPKTIAISKAYTEGSLMSLSCSCSGLSTVLCLHMSRVKCFKKPRLAIS